MKKKLPTLHNISAECDRTQIPRIYNNFLLLGLTALATRSSAIADKPRDTVL